MLHAVTEFTCTLKKIQVELTGTDGTGLDFHAASL